MAMSPKAAPKAGIEGRKSRVPADLLVYVRAGGLVRNEPTDPLAGRCGSEKNRTGRTPYCERAAGHGTKHQAIGRCRQHDKGENKYKQGLAPWLGMLTESEWRELTNAREVGPDGQFPTTHGAGYSGHLESYEQLLFRYIPEEDREIYQSLTTDPNKVIDLNIRLRQLAQFKMHRYEHRTNGECEIRKTEVLKQLMQVDVATADGQKLAAKLQEDLRLIKRYQDSIMIEVEPTHNRNAAVIARLLEVKARFAEVAGGEGTRDMIATMMRQVTDEDFARIKSDPIALAAFMSNNNAGKV